jgi:hypothetical protein
LKCAFPKPPKSFEASKASNPVFFTCPVAIIQCHIGPPTPAPIGVGLVDVFHSVMPLPALPHSQEIRKQPPLPPSPFSSKAQNAVKKPTPNAPHGCYTWPCMRGKGEGRKKKGCKFICPRQGSHRLCCEFTAPSAASAVVSRDLVYGSPAGARSGGHSG